MEIFNQFSLSMNEEKNFCLCVDIPDATYLHGTVPDRPGLPLSPIGPLSPGSPGTPISPVRKIIIKNH